MSYSHYGSDGAIDDRGMAALVELSLSGASFVAPRPMAIGSRVDLDLQLRNDLVAISGTVSRVSTSPEGETTIGVAIDRASESYADVLRVYFGTA